MKVFLFQWMPFQAHGICLIVITDALLDGYRSEVYRIHLMATRFALKFEFEVKGVNILDNC